ncbi:MAG: hypothetical protein ABJH20_24720 [Rhizobiaceae bacterium]
MVKDIGSGKHIIVFRGTEFTSHTDVEAEKDMAAGAGTTSKIKLAIFLKKQLSVGKNQYDAGKEKLHKWVDDHAGNVAVAGHSLGGALAQRLLLDKADKITNAKVFNSPGLEAEALKKAAKSRKLMESLMNKEGEMKLQIFNTRSDTVGKIGGPHAPGSVYIANGGRVEGNPHNGMIFSPNSSGNPSIKAVSYFMHQLAKGQALPEVRPTGMGWSDIKQFYADWYYEFAALYINYHKTDMDEIKEVLSDIRDLTIDVRREKLRPDLKEKRLKNEALMTAALNELGLFQTKAETKSTTLELEDTPVVQPINPSQNLTTSKQKRANTKHGDKQIAIQPTASAAKEEKADFYGIYGDFTGTFVGRTDEGATLENGRFNMTISGLIVTGNASGNGVHRRRDGDRERIVTDSITGKIIDGTYDPKTGKVTAVLLIKAGTFDDMRAAVQGRGDENGFSGTWYGGWGFTGTWQANPKTARTVTWEEAQCTGPNRDYWISQGTDCSDYR